MRRPLLTLKDKILNPKYDPLMKDMKYINWTYKAKNITITRNGVAFNPLCTLNYTGGNIFGNNELVIWGTD